MNESDLNSILQGVEDYDLELKEARSEFSAKKLVDYCAGLANENGGYIILGVADDKRIVGCNAFQSNWNKLAHQITTGIGVRVLVSQVNTSGGRVLVFKVSQHNVGVPVKAVGGQGRLAYPIRDGESLVEMSQQTLQAIFDEREEDWSAETVAGYKLEDLDQDALLDYRKRWAEHTKDAAKNSGSIKEMLTSLQLMVDGQLTNAALLLFAKEPVLSRAMPDAEIIFEWRNNPDDIPYGERKNWRSGFITVMDEIWQTVNARNISYRYQEGFTQKDIPSFEEKTIREAIINAFVHRDYRVTGRSILIKTSPEEFYIENPGKLVNGITLENIFDRSAWRNRHLAEALEKVNLMERSSQGIDTIFRNTIEAGKGLPKLVANDDPSISLEVPAQLIDQEFVSFLEKVAAEKQIVLSLKEIIELAKIRHGESVPHVKFKDKFLQLGLIEAVGRGRGVRYILSRSYYKYANAVGTHTRLTGLPREVKRKVVIEHLGKNGKITNAELREAIPDMSASAASTFLKSMRRDGLIKYEGKIPHGHWVVVTKDPIY